MPYKVESEKKNKTNSDSINHDTQYSQQQEQHRDERSNRNANTLYRKWLLFI